MQLQSAPMRNTQLISARRLLPLGARHHPAHGRDHQAAQDRLDQAEFDQPDLMRFGYGCANEAAANQCQRSKLRGGQIRGIGHAVHGSPILPLR